MISATVNERLHVDVRSLVNGVLEPLADGGAAAGGRDIADASRNQLKVWRTVTRRPVRCARCACLLAGLAAKFA